jgi:sodium-dependent dicarboxylate transporter 2/3/5
MRSLAKEALTRLGPLQAGEIATAGVFALAVIGWVGRPLWTQITLAGYQPLAGLTDTGVAILAALLLFILPAGRKPFVPVLDWESASKLPYGILLLFGGGLSLADAIERNGVGEFLGSYTGALQALPEFAFIAAVCLGILFLTEMTSNTATAATFIPLLAAVAVGAGWDPMKLMVPAALAASCAFMLPVATPPNAIAYASGKVDMASMLKAGVRLNLIAVILITGFAYFWAPQIFK